ncbi:vacuolar transporter chaperone [Gamsiella multidivaricata]|nr:vacuolar transporter chaperone [Gamsiella multidivaricata]
MAHHHYRQYQEQENQLAHPSFLSSSSPPPPSRLAYSPPPPSAPAAPSNPYHSQQPYQPLQPQQSNQSYQSAPGSRSQFPQPPIPPRPQFSGSHIQYTALPDTPPVPKRDSSSNFASYLPIPISPTTPTTPVTPVSSSDHPLAVQYTSLQPPQRSFLDRPLSLASGDRPFSVGSFDSTHSNDPLNPPAQAQPSKEPTTRKVNLRNRLQKEDQSTMQTARSITPQPWHPDYHSNSRSSTPNPLDLPEHRRPRRKSDESLSVMAEIDRNEKEGKDDNGQTALKKTRKNLFSRLGWKRTRVTYKVSGTGRLAQFSNERLYLHWIRYGILQGTIALTLLGFGNNVATYVGVGALILALLTLIYSTTLYHLRHLYMVTKRNDVVYYQRTVPTLLCLGLVLLYLGNFIVTMSIGDDARSPPPWTGVDDNSFHAFN